MEYQNILLKRDGHKALITLNRPDVLNSLNWDLLADMESALADLEKDPNIRVVIITGAGRAFSAGADLAFLKNLLVTPLKILEFLHLAHRVHNYIEKMSKPVIAAINGLALAGGLELAISCDLIIASETARLGDQHANYGIIPGGGGTQRLPRLIGIRRAKELLYTGKWLTPAEAERIGLINQVVPADKLLETANQLADKLASLSPMATKHMKFLVNQGMQVDLYTGLELEINTEFEHLFCEDYQEGLTAFNEKRKPKFPGR